MKFVQQLLALSLALAVAAWQSADLIGTFRAVGGGRHAFAEIHFGEKECFVKLNKSSNTGSNLFTGHWYTHGQKAILRGSADSEDKRIQFRFVSKDCIFYGNTEFRRVRGPSCLDTLAMVGHGYYRAANESSHFKRVLFTEGRMTLYKKKTYHGRWSVSTFSETSVTGRLHVENSKRVIPIIIKRISASSLKINHRRFTKEKEPSPKRSKKYSKTQTRRN